MRYAFAPGVFACIADGRLVLLNLALDRYLMLPPGQEASLRRLLNHEPDTPGDHDVRERLCTCGLVLTTAGGPAAALCTSEPATASLLDQDRQRPPASGVALAGLATLRASVRLQVVGLEGAIRHVASIPIPETNDYEAVVRQSSAFASLRLAIRSLDRCLPLSLALAGSCRPLQGNVRLILGVRCNPFGAHAWVQLGHTILNDHLEAVRPFTPILVV